MKKEDAKKILKQAESMTELDRSLRGEVHNASEQADGILNKMNEHVETLRAGANTDGELSKIAYEHADTLRASDASAANRTNIAGEINTFVDSLNDPASRVRHMLLSMFDATPPHDGEGITLYVPTPYKISSRMQTAYDLLRQLDPKCEHYKIEDSGDCRRITIDRELQDRLAPLCAVEPSERKPAQEAFLNSEDEAIGKKIEGAGKFSHAVAASASDWQTHIDKLNGKDTAERG